jgi:hypothetical protein
MTHAYQREIPPSASGYSAQTNRDQGYCPNLTSEAGRMMIRIRFAEALWLFEHPSKEARVAGQGAKRSTVLDYLFRLLLDW